MNHVSLFSGIGGIDLAAEWAGFHTIAFCESDPYCQKILNLRWPGVPICEDVHDMGREWLDEHGIGAITLVSGGPPCQPVSRTGKRRGKEDDRYLWPQMLRVISELKPRWVLGENPLGFLDMAFEETAASLEGLSYEVQAFVIPACSVEAEHERYRVFVVANNMRERGEGCRTQGVCWEQRIQGGEDERGVAALGTRADISEPPLCRNYDGVPDALDRLRCLGNAVVPAQVYPILKAIAEIERLQNIHAT